MSNINKTLKVVTIAYAVLLSVVAILGIFDAVTFLSLGLSELFKTTITNIGESFSFSNAPYYGIVFIAITLIYSFVSVIWIYYIVKKKSFDSILLCVLSFLSLIVLIPFVANFGDLYPTRLFDGEIFVFLLFLMVIGVFALSLSIYAFDFFRLLNRKIEANQEENAKSETVILEEDTYSEHSGIKEEYAGNSVNNTNVIINNYGDSSESVNVVDLITAANQPSLKRRTTTKTTNSTHRFQTTSGVTADRNPTQTFQEKMREVNNDVRSAYNEVKTELLRCGLKSRVTSSCDTFRLNKTVYAKVTITGQSLKIYLALDPNNYSNTGIQVTTTPKETYKDVPAVFKMQDKGQMGKAIILIKDLAVTYRLVRDETIQIQNYAQEIINL